MQDQQQEQEAPDRVKVYGACAGSGEWWTGYLFTPCPDHPGKYIISESHISSSEGWSRNDICGSFHAAKSWPDAECVWIGKLPPSASDDDLPFDACSKADHPDDRAPDEIAEAAS